MTAGSIASRGAFGRVLKLHALIAGNTARDIVAKPADLLVLIAGPPLFLAVLAPPLASLGREHPDALLVAVSLAAAAAGRAVARSWSKRGRSLQEGGVLSGSLLLKGGSRGMSMLIHAFALFGCIAAAGVFSISAGSPWLAGATGLAYLGGAVSTAATPRGIAPRFARVAYPNGAATARVPASVAAFIIRRRVGMNRDHRWLLAACAAVAAGAALLASVMSTTLSAQAAFGPLAVVSVTILRLARLDVDLMRALDMVGASIVRSTSWCLTPAWTVALSYCLAAALLRSRSSHMLLPLLVALAATASFLLRGWRISAMSRRAADLTTFVDLVAAAMLSLLLAPLGPVYLAGRILLLYRGMRGMRKW